LTKQTYQCHYTWVYFSGVISFLTCYHVDHMTFCS
jgi:hypothetical protein